MLASSLFSAEDFPERWQCGIWSPLHGWTHIISDVVIWMSYMAIPFLILWYLREKKGIENKGIFWLFIAFIFFCGSTHLMEAVVFYWPAYRLLGVLKLITAIVSAATVIALVFVIPAAIRAPTRRELEQEIELRKEADKRTQVSEGLFRTAMNSAPIGMALVGIDGKWLQVNEQLCQLLGYSPDELSEMDFQQITHPEDLDNDLSLLNDTLEGKMSGYMMRKRYFHKNGDIIYALLQVALIRNSVGEPEYFISQIENTTNEQKLLSQQSNFIRELELKTHDLQQIVYVTSHDLRSPLVNIIGFSAELEHALEDLRREVEASSEPNPRALAICRNEIPELLNYISGSATRMDRLLNGLLKYSRLGRYPMEIAEIDMNDLLHHLQEDLSYQLKEIEADVQVDELPTCFGDLTLINQLFRNLIDNAIKYRSPERNLKIHITASEEESHIRYTVADNGVGVDPMYRKKIFEFFHQLDPDKSDGDGLGLSICSLIAQRMNGSITLESTSGEGCQFHVLLSRNEESLNARHEVVQNARTGLIQTNF